MTSHLHFDVGPCFKKSEELLGLTSPRGAVAVWKVDQHPVCGWRWQVTRWDRGEVSGWALTESAARRSAFEQVDAAHEAARAA